MTKSGMGAFGTLVVAGLAGSGAVLADTTDVTWQNQVEIAYIEREHGLSREQAYILSSVAVDLVIGQVVDVPNYTVSAILDLEVFDP